MTRTEIWPRFTRGLFLITLRAWGGGPISFARVPTRAFAGLLAAPLNWRIDMNQPSSTITAAAIAGFIAATILLIVKITWPEIYIQIPPEYQGYMVAAIAILIGYLKKENILPIAKP